MTIHLEPLELVSSSTGKSSGHSSEDWAEVVGVMVKKASISSVEARDVESGGDRVKRR